MKIDWRRNPHDRRIGGRKEVFSTAKGLVRKDKTRRWLAVLGAIGAAAIGLFLFAGDVVELYQNFFPPAATTDGSVPGPTPRLPCEKVAKRGLSCDGAGLIQALANDDHELIDLFLAANLGPASYLTDRHGGRPQVWEQAAESGLPGLPYLLAKTKSATVVSWDLACPARGSVFENRDGLCGASFHAVVRRYRDEIMCPILRLDPERRRFKDLVLEILDSDRKTAITKWREYSSDVSCAHVVDMPDVHDPNCNEANQMGVPFAICEARTCLAGRAKFRATYPTPETYVKERINMSDHMQMWAGLQTCEPNDARLREFAAYRSE